MDWSGSLPDDFERAGDRRVLYGAAMDEGQTVRHIRVDSVSDLSLLRGSKYTQSKIGDTFSEEKYLDWQMKRHDAGSVRKGKAKRLLLH